MKRHYLSLLASLVCFAGISFASPNYVNYQGRLTDAAGQPLPTGNYALEFNVYDSATAGTLIWGPFSQTVSVIEGNFNVLIGPEDSDSPTRSIVSAFANAGDRFIEISVNGGDPILPRQQYLSVPYAFKATTADTALAANHATTATTAGSATTLTGTEWNAAATASIAVGGMEQLEISTNGLRARGAHLKIDDGFGCFSVEADGTTLRGGFDTTGDGDTVLWARGGSRVRTTNTVMEPIGRMSLGSGGSRWWVVNTVNGMTQNSDERLKAEIEDLDLGLEEVLKMRPTRYHWRSSPNGPEKLGLIAQELQELVPEVVKVGDDKDQTLGVAYADLIPVLIKAIQEQQDQINQLKAQLE